MATSGVSIYQLTRNQIIDAALRKLGVLALGQAPDTEQYTNGQIGLNAIIAELQSMGMPIWARATYTVSLVAGQRDYTIGTGQSISTPFPVSIHQATLTDTASGSVLDMEQRSIYDFNRLPTTSQGQPVVFTYQPKINLGVISVWPAPDATTASAKSLKLTYQRPFEGFTAGTETPDFPQEWQNALIYQLAVSLAPEYGVPLEDRKLLMTEAKMHIDSALSMGTENSSMYWQPDWR